MYEEGAIDMGIGCVEIIVCVIDILVFLEDGESGRAFAACLECARSV
jgi:hypothetical protein